MLHLLRQMQRAEMRAGSVAGCVVRDSETYLPYYRKNTY